MALQVYHVTILKIGYYNTFKQERYLRNALDYFISLTFLLPFIFIGKFIDPNFLDGPEDEAGEDGEIKIVPLEWLGFLNDEYIHFTCGFAQVILFGLVFFTGLLILLFPFYRNVSLIMRNIEKLHFNWNLRKNPQYMNELENKS